MTISLRAVSNGYDMLTASAYPIHWTPFYYIHFKMNYITKNEDLCHFGPFGFSRSDHRTDHTFILFVPIFIPWPGHRAVLNVVDLNMMSISDICLRTTICLIFIFICLLCMLSISFVCWYLQSNKTCLLLTVLPTLCSLSSIICWYGPLFFHLCRIYCWVNFGHKPYDHGHFPGYETPTDRDALIKK